MIHFKYKITSMIDAPRRGAMVIGYADVTHLIIGHGHQNPLRIYLLLKLGGRLRELVLENTRQHSVINATRLGFNSYSHHNNLPQSYGAPLKYFSHPLVVSHP